MKRCRRLPGKGPLALLAGGLVVAVVGAGAPAAAPARTPDSAPDRVAIDDLERRFDANLIDMFVSNIGTLAYDRTNGSGGLFFPRGSGRSALFAAGLWVGARVEGETRVTVSEYLSEWQPGRIVDEVPEPPEDEALRTWKVRPVPTFWSATDSLFLPGGAPADEVAHHAWSDYRTLAAPTGAPVVLLGTTSSPGPALSGELALWSVFNDANPARHTSAAAGTAPLGLEVRQVVFGFDTTPAAGAFVRWTLVHHGSAPLEGAVVTFWVDPDLGGAGDDLVGWDPALQMGYVYNATNADNVYTNRPPAVGVRYLSGTTGTQAGAFNKYIGGSDPNGAIESDRLMRGLQANGTPWIDPTTGQPTTFPFAGDPLTQEGWRDSLPSDRRFLVSTPPFDLAEGDSATFLFAIFVGQGYERLDSIRNLRCQASRIETPFDEMLPYPARITLLQAESTTGVHLAWYVGGSDPEELHLRRHFGTATEWPDDSELLATLLPDVTSRLTYDDEPLPPGQTWTYGLFDRCDPFYPRARVILTGLDTTPSFRAVSPVTGGAVVLFATFATTEPARLEAFSVSGRRMLDREIVPPAAGPMTAPVADTEAWPAGLYVFRLTQAGQVLTTRSVIVR